MILLRECADRQCADLDTEIGSDLGLDPVSSSPPP